MIFLSLSSHKHSIVILQLDPKDILLVSNREDRPQDDTMSIAVHIDKKTNPNG
jgi:hypothetical protein